MTKKFDDLNDTFNVEAEILPKEEVPKKIEKISKESNDVTKD